MIYLEIIFFIYSAFSILVSLIVFFGNAIFVNAEFFHDPFYMSLLKDIAQMMLYINPFFVIFGLVSTIKVSKRKISPTMFYFTLGLVVASIYLMLLFLSLH